MKRPLHLMVVGRNLLFLGVAFFLVGGALAQTTQGVIVGTISDLTTGRPIAGARVQYRNLDTNDSGDITTDSGSYSLSGLSPGRYWLRVEGASPPANAGPLEITNNESTHPPQLEEGFQAQEIHGLEIPVASWLELDFVLRPLRNVWEKNIPSALLLPEGSRIVNFFGPDVESGRRISLRPLALHMGTSLPTLSYVVSPVEVQELPLSQRDIYAMLVTQPGVTADNATARGLGLSINGQRPSSSNFLLDGVENNDYLLTGPASVVAPEAVQEYRVSTNNFSAEFGRTAGYIANAVTRSGGTDFHGLIYTYVGNEKLHANSFQRNASGIDRGPRKDVHAGFWLGGPILPDKLFFSTAFERFTSRGSDDPRSFQIPILSRFEACPQTAASHGARLLRQFAPPAVSAPPLTGGDPCQSLSAPYETSPPVELDRTLLVARGDYYLPARQTQKITTRLTHSNFDEPFFVYSPYENFSSPLRDDSTGIAATYNGLFGPSLLSTRFGWRQTELGWDRPLDDVPVLSSFDRTTLPGSPAFYAFDNRGQSWEMTATLQTGHGRHVQTAGGGLLWRSPESNLTYGRDGIFLFDGALAFGSDKPFMFLTSVSREALAAGRQSQPQFHRTHSYRDFFAFWQDNLQLSRRLGLTMGVRYEMFDPRKNTGVQDVTVRLGNGSTTEEQIKNAGLDFDPTERRAHQPDRNNWAGRLGISYAPFEGRSNLVLRAAYGIFFDRGFDNLVLSTRNNSFDLFRFDAAGGLQFPQSVAEVLNTVDGRSLRDTSLLWVDDSLRTPYVESWFAGLQGQITRNTSFEISHFGASGRKLIATDYLNRIFSDPCAETRTCEGSNIEGRLQADWSDLVYRSNFGSSSYAALGGLLRHRGRRTLLQIAYTYGHSIDNQSEPMLGDSFDLRFTSSSPASERNDIATLTRAFDSRLDRGSSDFDQRHNLVIFSIWQLPSVRSQTWLQHLADGWQVSTLAGFRSGFPFTVFAGPELSSLLRNRPDQLVNVDPISPDPSRVPGGVQLLDTGAFVRPTVGTVGTLGRNSIAGPGFWNVDFSVRKALPLTKLSDTARLEVRADFFNLLNHANLGNPNVLLTSGKFGQASFGRSGLESNFPGLTPLSESPRTIQLQLKLHF